MLKKILKSDLLKASFWSVLTEICLKVVTPVTYLILTRYINPDEFGAVSVITTIVAFLTIISDLGVSKLLVQNNQFNKNEFELFINHCITLSLFLGLLMMFILQFSTVFIVDFFDIKNNQLDLYLLSLNIPILAVTGSLNGLLRKSFHFKKLFLIKVVSIIVPSIISIILIFNGFGITSIILSQLFTSILNLILSYNAIDYKYKYYFNFEYNKLIFGNSIWSSFEQIFMWLPMSIDVFLITKYLSKHDLGMYTTSRTIFTSAIALSLGAILPVIFSLYSRNNKDKDLLVSIFKSTHFFIFFIAALLGISVFVFFEYFESILFNSKWTGVAEITSIVFLLLALNYFVNPFQEFFNSLGSFKFSSRLVIGNLIFTIPFLFLTVKQGLIIYIIVRFTFLFFKIIPIHIKLRKSNLNLSLYDLFLSSINIWGFIILNVLNKLLINNLIINIIVFITTSILLILLEKNNIINKIKFLSKIKTQ
ncbi:oligosaccharide flippase family protein [Empedobacter brevis]